MLRVQMFERLIATHWSPSCSSCKMPTSRSNEPPVQLWATWLSTVCNYQKPQTLSGLTLFSRKQGRDRVARWFGASDPTDDVSQRRSAVQRRGMHHQPCYPRREQGKNCSLRCSWPPDQASEIEGYEGPTQCNRCSVEHDAFR